MKNGEAAYEVTFGNPSSVWVDSNGPVFIYDSLFRAITVVRHNKIYLFAGKWQYADSPNTLMTGPASQVHIQASQIFGDSSKGVMYLSDGTRGGIQQISPLTVNLYAPTGTPTEAPTEAPSATPTITPTFAPTKPPVTPIISKMATMDAALTHPEGIWSDAAGNVFVSDSTNRIFVQSIGDSTVTVFAGSPTGAAGFAGDGMSLRNALFDYPQGLWGDDNFLYICDSHNHRIRAINRMTNVIHTVAGGGKDVISSDSPIQATTGLLILPIGIWGDGAGNIYISASNQYSRKQWTGGSLFGFKI
jgi:hypothetical protein